MKIEINSCNNIEKGEIKICEDKLNIKYALNGIGKSTIAYALDYTINNNLEGLYSLTPFKCKANANSDKQIKPSVKGERINGIKSVSIFNEDYVEQFVYQQDELIKNSFEIFVKTKKYDENMEKIRELTSGIQRAFKGDGKIDSLIEDMDNLVSAFGKESKTGIHKSSKLCKALSDGNKIENIPEGLEDYKEYLTSGEKTIKWLAWQQNGKSFLDMSNKCPYCAVPLEQGKLKIEKVSEIYDPKKVEYLNDIVKVFDKLNKYFTESAKEKVKNIIKNIKSFSPEEQNFLLEIRKQIETLKEKLSYIKEISFPSLKDVDKVIDVLKGSLIKLQYLEHLDTKCTRNEIEPINKALEDTIAKAGSLQGEINKQKNLIKETIEDNQKGINCFLQSAGYSYEVEITAINASYKIFLKHKDCSSIVDNPKRHLSYGERNAFALILFFYEVLKKNPDLIILDDPISSFDGNKKFAIINMLFMGKGKFCDKTILLLTHDFSTVIDIINLKHEINPKPVTHFLENKNNILSEKLIATENIKSFIDIARDNISKSKNMINKLIYLRRLFEIDKNKNMAWQILSSLFHKKSSPTVLKENDERPMTPKEKEEGLESIKKEIGGKKFVYEEELKEINDKAKMIALYRETSNNYEKLQLYRIVNNGNHENKIIKRFVNETYHVQNDNLFQLDPSEYEIVPDYLISFCDKDIKKIEIELKNQK